MILYRIGQNKQNGKLLECRNRSSLIFFWSDAFCISRFLNLFLYLTSRECHTAHCDMVFLKFHEVFVAVFILSHVGGIDSISKTCIMRKSYEVDSCELRVAESTVEETERFSLSIGQLLGNCILGCVKRSASKSSCTVLKLRDKHISIFRNRSHGQEAVGVSRTSADSCRLHFFRL